MKLNPKIFEDAAELVASNKVAPSYLTALYVAIYKHDLKDYNEYHNTLDLHVFFFVDLIIASTLHERNCFHYFGETDEFRRDHYCTALLLCAEICRSGVKE